MNKPMVRVAQITDMHVSKNKQDYVRGINTYRRYCCVIDAVRRENFDSLFFTGDCSEDGSRESYELMWDYLGDLQPKVKFIPGNHDSNAIYDVFGRSFLDNGDGIFEFLNWKVLFLHTKVGGQAYGVLADSELIRLSQFLKNTNAAHKAIVLHHNPVSVGCGELDPYMLQNHQVFKDLIYQDSSVKLVLFGHVHHDYGYLINHTQFECGPSSGFQFFNGSDELDGRNFGYKEYFFSEMGFSSQVKWSYAYETVKLD